MVTLFYWLLTYVIGCLCRRYERLAFSSHVSGSHKVKIKSKPMANKEPSIEKLASVVSNIR